jgi:hypothetical protein
LTFTDPPVILYRGSKLPQQLAKDRPNLIETYAYSIAYRRYQEKEQEAEAGLAVWDFMLARFT